MRDCNKRCIAAVNSKCAVEDCQGEIQSFGYMAMEMFDEDFSKEVPHE